MSRSAAMNDSFPCILCGSISAEYMYPKAGIMRCGGCGLARADKFPGEERIARLYSENYFRSSDSGALGYDDYIGDRTKISRTFERRLREIEDWIGHKGRLLDVGCAMGFSLEVASKRGWKVNGIEISEYACNFARDTLGIDVTCGSLDRSNFEPGSFDVVTMWDYIEHSLEPRNELKHAYDLLKTGGLLVLTTPNIASLPARIFRTRWMGIKQEEHLYYFSPNTIRHLLREVSFEPVRLEHVGKYIDLDFFIKRAGLYSTVVRSLLERISGALGIGGRVLYVNPFDIMLVYGRKTSGRQ